MHGVPQIVAAAVEATKDMAPDERYAALTATAPQVMNTMPPRENPRLNKSLDSVHASGPLGRAHCVIHGNSNYKQTGLLQAYAAYSLLQQPPPPGRLRVGLPGLRAPRAARACCAASAWSREPVVTVEAAERCGWSTTSTRARRSDPDAPVPDHRRRQPQSYAEVQELSSPHRGGPGRAGASRPGDKVAILSANDPDAFTCVFGISRAGAVWCPINPRNEAAENRELLDLFDCTRADLPGVVRAAGRPDPRRPART